MWGGKSRQQPKSAAAAGTPNFMSPLKGKAGAATAAAAAAGRKQAGSHASSKSAIARTKGVDSKAATITPSQLRGRQRLDGSTMEGPSQLSDASTISASSAVPTSEGSILDFSQIEGASVISRSSMGERDSFGRILEPNTMGRMSAASEIAPRESSIGGGRISTGDNQCTTSLQQQQLHISELLTENQTLQEKLHSLAGQVKEAESEKAALRAQLEDAAERQENSPARSEGSNGESDEQYLIEQVCSPPSPPPLTWELDRWRCMKTGACDLMCLERYPMPGTCAVRGGCPAAKRSSRPFEAPSAGPRRPRCRRREWLREIVLGSRRRARAESAEWSRVCAGC